MKSLKEQFIVYVVKEAGRRRGGARPARVMDLGCGTAGYVPHMLKEVSNVEYVGVEPIKASYDTALKNLEGLSNCKVHFQLGYDEVPDEEDGSFDLVFSLSALEHIRQLDRFLALSAKYVRQGGMMVHRYDLGHALYPHSYKEQFHVFVGNTFPSLLPERKFVRYVGVPEVQGLYEKNGITPTNVTHHQMPNHKEFEKYVRGTQTTAVKELFDWEMKHQDVFTNIPTKKREKLFPAVAVWGEKR